MSAQAQPAPDIAHLLKTSEDYVRDVIHAFNERGFDALDPKWSGNAPKRIDEQTHEWICVIARCDPRFLGRPFSCWSLTKLRDYLIDAATSEGSASRRSGGSCMSVTFRRRPPRHGRPAPTPTSRRRCTGSWASTITPPTGG
ncbi:helix-turn-helix domain-containing protein [Micromonospora sp. NPDC023737]|uniref:helix-turn-helix domain-containing protein n=1 Tax=unclassified Micromonospora TaxID=2617518 RepID=UPI0033F5763F